MASSERLTGMWQDLKRAKRLPASPNLVVSCETELQELMKQIDIMVHERRMEWERDVQRLQGRLEVKDNENMIQKTTLEQKHREIGQLRHQLEGQETAQRDMVIEYERQLAHIKGEATNLRKAYEKLQRKHGKNSKDTEKEKQKTSFELKESLSEIDRLKKQLEEYRIQSREWDLQKTTYQTQIDSLESQRKTLAEKCDFIQHQSSGYQSELEKRRHLLESSEVTLKSQISRLEGELERSKDIIETQNIELDRLRASQEEFKVNEMHLSQQCASLQQDLKQLLSQKERLEETLKELQLEVRSKADMLNIAENDGQRFNKDMYHVEQELQLKDKRIRQLELLCQKKDTEQTVMLKHQIEDLEDELKTVQKSEAKLKREVQSQEEKLVKLKQERVNIETQLAKKTEENKYTESTISRQLNSEINKLREQIYSLNTAHAGEISGMKKELESLTSELHDKNIALSKMVEKSSEMGAKTYEEERRFEKRGAELQVANAQLEALRLENRHLMQTMMRQKDKNLDMAEAEDHLRQLQNSYTLSLAKLQEENKVLRDDVDKLKDQLKVCDDTYRASLGSTRYTTEQAIEDIRQTEQRKIQAMQFDNDRRLAEMADKFQTTLQQYEQKIQALQATNSQLEVEINNQDKSLRKLEGENEAMTSFVENVSGVVQSPPKRQGLSQYASDHDGMNQEEYFSTTSMLTAEYLNEEQERTRDLERVINSHIDNLKTQSEKTIQDYLTRTKGNL
ncbi:unnamed protein product [Owenia fusiformis]|uniref:Centrosomal protein of 63 kDa n=1 Tax=Owenia fusiformis TaxID=6347 RepID=A0A8S4NMD6_OWEFU|nr:unnamed protein product [Owenia fusiformis]